MLTAQPGSLNSSTTVVVGLSGGVDSSVTALLLKQQGYNVRGVFMQNWEDDDDQCTVRQDYKDASAVCSTLGIELQTVNFSEEYWQRVFQHFLNEYSAGRTPNPDILCNQEIKFKAFLEYAQEQGCDYIATGHYARTKHGPSHTSLLRGIDSSKDQSYFLYTLGQSQLKNVLFPIGDLEKIEVRRLAKQAGIHVHSKKDSTGICFIGERKFRHFLAQYLPAKPGSIITDQGRQIGEHFGLMYYTLGQRQGLGIGGVAAALEKPWYVIDKDLINNKLIVAQGHDHPKLFRKQIAAHDATWCMGSPPDEDFTCTAKVRYRQVDQPVTVSVSAATNSLELEFSDPVWAATPGQSVVLYQGECCLGGAIISDFS